MATFPPPDLLERIWFYTNFDCNLGCVYCVAAQVPGTMRPRLGLPAFKRLLDQAVTLGFRQAALTGGEPFLHPDIVDMLEYAAARIDTVVLTNALPIDHGIVGDLSRVDRDRLLIQVSLDSADPAVNDRLRGRYCYDNTLRGLRLLLDAGYRISVRATLDGQGETSMAELADLMDKIGVPSEQVYGAPVAKAGRSTHGHEISMARLCPEPTVIGDGLYWHPLMIDPVTAIAARPDPLEVSLKILADRAERVKPVATKGIR